MVINGVQAVKMPIDNMNWMRFRNHKRGLEVPLVVYADFESIVEKVDTSSGEELKRTQLYQKHKGCEYGLKVVCCYDGRRLEVYRGPVAIYKFIETSRD